MTYSTSTQEWLNRDRRLAAQMRGLATKASEPGTQRISTTVQIDGVLYKVTVEDKRGPWSRDRRA